MSNRPGLKSQEQQQQKHGATPMQIPVGTASNSKVNVRSQQHETMKYFNSAPVYGFDMAGFGSNSQPQNRHAAQAIQEQQFQQQSRQANVLQFQQMQQDSLLSTINPSMLLQDPYDGLSDTLFPLTIDSEMKDMGSDGDKDGRFVDSNAVSPYDIPNDDIEGSLPASPGPYGSAGSHHDIVNPHGNDSKSSLDGSVGSLSTTSRSFNQQSISLASSAPVASPSRQKTAEDTTQLAHHVLLLDKQRKRRESHNAVERRRRDNINDRIHELGLVVPDCAGDLGKAHKGTILRKAIEFIRRLHDANDRLSKKVAALEEELSKYR